ncbi:MAG: NYN domain-containing protein [Candidatus Omnitrophota bacterium]
MSLHFILDGYNIIRRIPKLDSDNLRQSRKNLVDFIIKYQPQGSSRNGLTIVFDGKADILYHKDVSNIRIIFSEGESADDLIVSIILKSVNKKNICLVSDDRGLISRIDGLGVKVYSVSDFVSRTGVFKKNKLAQDNKSILGYSQIEKINRELKGIWLDSNNSG